MDDELYQVPLAQFTATRDRIAARLKAAGDERAAAETKRARKPTVPAWAANQVVWRARPEWERLRAAARALRRSHEAAASVEERQEAGREQREALRACEQRGSELLQQHGHAAGPAVIEKVGRTLLALAYGAPGARPGRLEQELQPPGFDLLESVALATPQSLRGPAAIAAGRATAAAPVSDAARTKAGREGQDEERAGRRAGLAEAEARRSASQRALGEARQRLAADDERRRALERELDSVRRACEESRRQLERAEAEDLQAATALETLRARLQS